MAAGPPAQRRARCCHCRRALGAAEPGLTLTHRGRPVDVCRVCYLAVEVALRLPALAALTGDDDEFRHDLLRVLETLYELACDGPT